MKVKVLVDTVKDKKGVNWDKDSTFIAEDRLEEATIKEYLEGKLIVSLDEPQVQESQEEKDTAKDIA